MASSPAPTVPFTTTPERVKQVTRSWEAKGSQTRTGSADASHTHKYWVGSACAIYVSAVSCEGFLRPATTVMSALVGGIRHHLRAENKLTAVCLSAGRHAHQRFPIPKHNLAADHKSMPYLSRVGHMRPRHAPTVAQYLT